MEDHGATEVLICGAGAAGLTLAIDLARRGTRFRLIDRLAAPFAGSRGKGIQPRTQEVFEDLGIIDRIAALGSAYPPQRKYHTDGSHDDVQDIAAAPPTAGEPYRTPLLVPQCRTEAVMRERLAESGAAPEYGRELLGFEQDACVVTARVSGPSGLETIRCHYLVGSDGGRSVVRHALQLGFPGKTLGVRAIVADVELDGLSRDAWHRFNEGDVPHQLSLCPLPHTDLFQLRAPVPSRATSSCLRPASRPSSTRERPARGIAVRGVAWASPYGMSARLAERYRVSRVFLVGDAAHIHPLTGDQGLNTSVQDACNLGWKLGAALAGAPDAVLDSDEEERRPIAAGMLGLATALLEEARRGITRRGREVHQLDLGYAGSSLSLTSADRHGDVLAGDRAPDALLHGAGGQPKRLFDLLEGTALDADRAGRRCRPLPKSGRMLRVHRVGAGR